MIASVMWNVGLHNNEYCHRHPTRLVYLWRLEANTIVNEVTFKEGLKHTGDW